MSALTFLIFCCSATLDLLFYFALATVTLLVLCSCWCNWPAVELSLPGVHNSCNAKQDVDIASQKGVTGTENSIQSTFFHAQPMENITEHFSTTAHFTALCVAGCHVLLCGTQAGAVYRIFLSISQRNQYDCRFFLVILSMWQFVNNFRCPVILFIDTKVQQNGRGVDESSDGV